MRGLRLGRHVCKSNIEGVCSSRNAYLHNFLDLTFSPLGGMVNLFKLGHLSLWDVPTKHDGGALGRLSEEPAGHVMQGHAVQQTVIHGSDSVRCGWVRSS